MILTLRAFFLFTAIFLSSQSFAESNAQQVRDYLAVPTNQEKYTPETLAFLKGVLALSKPNEQISLHSVLRAVSVGADTDVNRNNYLKVTLTKSEDYDALIKLLREQLPKGNENYPLLLGSNSFLKVCESMAGTDEKVTPKLLFEALVADGSGPVKALVDSFNKTRNDSEKLTPERVRTGRAGVSTVANTNPVEVANATRNFKLRDVAYPADKAGEDFIKSVIKDLSVDAATRLTTGNRPKFTERPGQIDALKQSLFREDKNGTFIVAKRGAGKTATVRDGLTYDLLDTEKTHPESVLYGMRVMQLDNHAFMGDKTLSPSEKIKYLIEFIKLNSKKTKEPRSVGNMLLFIDEVHELKKEKDGMPQLFDALKIPLVNGEANLIVATTDEEFLKNFTEAGDDAILRRLVISNIEMFNESEVFTILKAFTKDPNRSLSEEQLQKIIELAKAYFPSDSLIDKVIDIIHEVEGVQRFKADKEGRGVSRFSFDDAVVFEALSRLTGISYKFLARTPKEVSDELRTRLASYFPEKEQLEHLVQTIRAATFSKTKPYKNKLNLLLLIDDPVKAKKITEIILNCIYGLSEQRITSITAGELGEGERLLQKLMGYEGLYVGAKTATDVLSRMKENQRGALLVHGIEKTIDPANLFSVLNRWITQGFDYSPNKPGAIDTSGTIMIFTVSRKDIAHQLAKNATEINRKKHDGSNASPLTVRPEAVPDHDILKAVEHLLPRDFLTLVSSGKVIVKDVEEMGPRVGEFETIVIDKIMEVIRDLERDYKVSIKLSELEKTILKNHYLSKIGIYGTDRSNLNYFLDIEINGSLKDLIETYVITEKAKNDFSGEVTLSTDAIKIKICGPVIKRLAEQTN